MALLKLDTLAINPDNLRTYDVTLNPPVSINSRQVIVLECGLFHTRRHTPILTLAGTKLDRGVDYEFIYSSRHFKNAYGGEAVGGFVILNKNLDAGELSITVHGLGGPYQYFSPADVPEVIELVSNNVPVQFWDEVVEAPFTAKPEAKPTPAGQLKTNFHDLSAVLHTVAQMILESSEEDPRIPKLQEEMVEVMASMPVNDLTIDAPTNLVAETVQAGANFGKSLAFVEDGFLMVGAPNYTVENNHVGALELYTLVDNVPVYQSTIVGSNTDTEFGFLVGYAKNTAAVASKRGGNTIITRYEFVNGGLVEHEAITVTGIIDDLQLTEKQLFVSISTTDQGELTNVGSVTAYDVVEGTGFVNPAAITVHAPVADKGFGKTIATDGSTLFVGNNSKSIDVYEVVDTTIKYRFTVEVEKTYDNLATDKDLLYVSSSLEEVGEVTVYGFAAYGILRKRLTRVGSVTPSGKGLGTGFAFARERLFMGEAGFDGASVGMGRVLVSPYFVKINRGNGIGIDPLLLKRVTANETNIIEIFKQLANINAKLDLHEKQLLALTAGNPPLDLDGIDLTLSRPDKYNAAIKHGGFYLVGARNLEVYPIDDENRTLKAKVATSVDFGGTVCSLTANEQYVFATIYKGSGDMYSEHSLITDYYIYVLSISDVGVPSVLTQTRCSPSFGGSQVKCHNGLVYIGRNINDVRSYDYNTTDGLLLNHTYAAAQTPDVKGLVVIGDYLYVRKNNVLSRLDGTVVGTLPTYTVDGTNLFLPFGDFVYEGGNIYITEAKNEVTEQYCIVRYQMSLDKAGEPILDNVTIQGVYDCELNKLIGLELANSEGYTSVLAVKEPLNVTAGVLQAVYIKLPHYATDATGEIGELAGQLLKQAEQIKNLNRYLSFPNPINELPATTETAGHIVELGDFVVTMEKDTNMLKSSRRLHDGSFEMGQSLTLPLAKMSNMIVIEDVIFMTVGAHNTVRLIAVTIDELGRFTVAHQELPEAPHKFGGYTFGNSLDAIYTSTTTNNTLKYSYNKDAGFTYVSIRGVNTSNYAGFFSVDGTDYIAMNESNDGDVAQITIREFDSWSVKGKFDSIGEFHYIPQGQVVEIQSYNGELVTLAKSAVDGLWHLVKFSVDLVNGFGNLERNYTSLELSTGLSSVAFSHSITRAGYAVAGIDGNGKFLAGVVPFSLTGQTEELLDALRAEVDALKAKDVLTDAEIARINGEIEHAVRNDQGVTVLKPKGGSNKIPGQFTGPVDIHIPWVRNGFYTVEFLVINASAAIRQFRVSMFIRDDGSKFTFSATEAQMLSNSSPLQIALDRVVKDGQLGVVLRVGDERSVNTDICISVTACTYVGAGNVIGLAEGWDIVKGPVNGGGTTIPVARNYSSVVKPTHAELDVYSTSEIDAMLSNVGGVGTTSSTFKTLQQSLRDSLEGSGIYQFGTDHEDEQHAVQRGMSIVEGPYNNCSFTYGRPNGDKEMIIVADGIRFFTGGLSVTDEKYALIKFAPNHTGKVTWNIANGTYYTHSSAEVAFNSAESNPDLRVVTESEDPIVFKYKLIKLTDAVYPKGQTQFVGKTYLGTTLVTAASLNKPAGESSFNHFTPVTAKVGSWATMTEMEKRIWQCDPENNIYRDDITGEYMQYIFKIETPVMPNAEVLDWKLGYYAHNAKVGAAFGSWVVSNEAGAFAVDPNQKGLLRRDDIGGFILGYVGRFNQGIYHPDHNQGGCSIAADNKLWLNTNPTLATTKVCFTAARGSGSGRIDNYDLENTLYIGTVKDFRLSCRKRCDSELLETEFRRACEGKMRGLAPVVNVKHIAIEKPTGKEAVGKMLRINMPTAISAESYGTKYVTEKTTQGPKVISASNSFGASLSVTKDGKTLVASYPSSTIGESADKVGIVEILEVTSSGYILKQRIESPNPEANGWFGSRVAISGDGSWLAIRGVFNKVWAVFIYAYDTEADNFVYVSMIDNSAISGDNLGLGTGLAFTYTGDRLYVGTSNAAEPAVNSGVLTYYDNYGGEFEFVGKVRSPREQVNEYYGSSVTVSEDGTTVIVGASGRNGVVDDVGCLYQYVVAGDTLNFVRTITHNVEGHATLGFGEGVELTDNGLVLMAGCHRDTDPAQTGTDVVIKFRRDENGVYQQVEVIDSGLTGSRYGVAIAAVNEDNYFIGAPRVVKGVFYHYVSTLSELEVVGKLIDSNKNSFDVISYSGKSFKLHPKYGNQLDLVNIASDVTLVVYETVSKLTYDMVPQVDIIGIPSAEMVGMQGEWLPTEVFLGEHNVRLNHPSESSLADLVYFNGLEWKIRRDIPVNQVTNEIRLNMNAVKVGMIFYRRLAPFTKTVKAQPAKLVGDYVYVTSSYRKEEGARLHHSTVGGFGTQANVKPELAAVQRIVKDADGVVVKVEHNPVRNR